MNRIRTLFAFAALLAVLVTSACGKPDLAKLQNIADEMRIHNRNIARVTNEFHASGKLDDQFHLSVLRANDRFSKALDGADAAIASAKTITEKTAAKTALDYARRILDVDAFPAYLDIVESVIGVPPEVRSKIEQYLNLIRVAFAAVQAIFADAGIAVKLEDRYV